MVLALPCDRYEGHAPSLRAHGWILGADIIVILQFYRMQKGIERLENHKNQPEKKLRG